MRKISNLLLVLEAIICIILSVLLRSQGDTVMNIVSFPFKQIGKFVRELSLQGGVFNVLAWTLYIGICVIPIIVMLVLIIKRKFAIEDTLLTVLSVTMFVAMYNIINNKYIMESIIVDLDKDFVISLLGILIYSVIGGYLIIKVTKVFRKANSNKAKTFLNCILTFINMLLIYSTFYQGLSELLNKYDNLVEMEELMEYEVLISKVFVVGEFSFRVILELILVAIIIYIQNIVHRLDISNLTDDVSEKIKKVSCCCELLIIARAIFYIVFNILQFIFINKLCYINEIITLPIYELLLMLVFVVFAKFITDVKSVKEENDMFV